MTSKVGCWHMAYDEPMTLRQAQGAVDASIAALGGYWPPLANLARLFEECGELARVVNQTTGPKVTKPSEQASTVAEELGDALYTLLVLANSLDVDAQDALRGALRKAHERVVPATPVVQPPCEEETDG